MKDLLGNIIDVPPDRAMTPEERRKLHRVSATTRPYARASALPGPLGERCGTCLFSKAREVGSGKRYYKCMMAKRKATRGPGTDIRLKDVACSQWRKR